MIAREFYAVRAGFRRRLIEERGFTAVVGEADWPDAYRVNRFVRGAGGDGTADEALGGWGDVSAAMRGSRLQRAIGVIYRPQTERISHYFKARVAAQFNVMVHLDHTRALSALDSWPEADAHHEYETYPSGV